MKRRQLLGTAAAGTVAAVAGGAAAQQLAVDAGIADARFVCADVYDAAEAVGGERFDIVYTGLGAINWLHDIERWAATFDDERDDAALVPRYDYFGHEWHDTSETFTGSYGAQDAVTEFNNTHERVWTLGEVVSAVTGAGFRLEFLHEHDYTLFDSLRFLVRTGRGYELQIGRAHV